MTSQIPPTPEEIESIAYESKEPDRGYTVRASYLKTKADAWVEIMKDGRLLRAFRYPAYKVWNIAAHFSDIVDGEIENSDAGYRQASWNGITPMGEPKPLDEKN